MAALKTNNVTPTTLGLKKKAKQSKKMKGGDSSFITKKIALTFKNRAKVVSASTVSPNQDGSIKDILNTKT